MTLEQLCVKQEEQITRQSIIIRELLEQLIQYRELTQEEIRLIEDDGK